MRVGGSLVDVSLNFNDTAAELDESGSTSEVGGHCHHAFHVLMISMIYPVLSDRKSDTDANFT
jgi:hypothetical protein